MKKFAEFMFNAGNALFSVAYVAAGAVLLVVAVVWLSRHVTCFNIFDKVCFVY